MRYRSHVEFRVNLVVAGVLLAALPSCMGRAADTKERVKRFEAKLSEELGTEVKLQCPTMVDNSYHYCTAVIPAQDDLAFPVRVTSRGDELDYTTKRWVTGARMEELGTHALKEKLDLDVDSFACPRISHMPDGAKVSCEATVEGVTIPVEVGMVLKVRKLEFEPVGGVIFGDQAARVAHETLHERGVHAEVTCDRAVVVSVPGRRFECEAHIAGKPVSTVHFLITSAEGAFELGTEPPSADEPADGEAAEAARADGAR